MIDAETSQPIPDARVGLIELRPNQSDFGWYWAVNGADVEWTSANGVARFPSLDRGDALLFVQHPGYSWQRLAWTSKAQPPAANTAPEQIEFRLTKEARLRVTLDGLAGRQPHLVYARLTTATAESFSTELVRRGDAHVFEFSHLPLGKLTLQISEYTEKDPSALVLEKELDLRPGDNKLTIPLPPPPPQPNILNEAMKKLVESLQRQNAPSVP